MKALGMDAWRAGIGRRPRKIGVQALAALFTMMGAWPAGVAWAECRLKHLEIPVRVVDQRPIATLSLDGVEVPMLVDSGAFFSMLSPATAAQLQLRLFNLPPGMRLEGYAGRIDARMTRVGKVGLRNVELKDVEFIVGGNELGAGIKGVLGRNVLSMADAEYDLARGFVRLVFPMGECQKANLAYWAGTAPVIEAPMDDGQDAGSGIVVPVGINGHRTLALLDTGAPLSAITRRVARRAGIEDGALTPRGRVGGAGEGHVQSWSTRLERFELGGEQVANSIVEVDDTDWTDQGMLLGLDYFLSHRIYVSRLQGRLYATWNGGTVFALGRESPAALDPRYAAVPQDVSRDDADALWRRGLAALAAGDHRRAREDLDRACALAPGVADYFWARARLYQEMGRLDLAQADLDQTLRLDRSLAEARFRRALLNHAKGNPAGAQADLAQLDAELPPSEALRADMADLLAEMGRTADALRQFDLWLDAHPRDVRMASVLNSRCWMRTRLDIDLPLALEDCKRAVGLDGGSAAIHDSLGWTYLRLGDASKAREAFDRAIELRALPMSLYGRALANLQLHDRARGELDLAAARAKRPSVVEDARRRGFGFADAILRAAGPGP